MGAFYGSDDKNLDFPKRGDGNIRGQNSVNISPRLEFLTIKIKVIKDGAY